MHDAEKAPTEVKKKAENVEVNKPMEIATLKAEDITKEAEDITRNLVALKGMPAEMLSDEDQKIIADLEARAEQLTKELKRQKEIKNWFFEEIQKIGSEIGKKKYSMGESRGRSVSSAEKTYNTEMEGAKGDKAKEAQAFQKKDENLQKIESYYDETMKKIDDEENEKIKKVKEERDRRMNEK